MGTISPAFLPTHVPVESSTQKLVFIRTFVDFGARYYIATYAIFKPSKGHFEFQHEECWTLPLLQPSDRFREEQSSMPPKKRKASSMAAEEEEPAKPKLSKKELRAQAIERARLSMEGDKKKVEALKAKKAGKSPVKEEKEYESAKKRRKTAAKDESATAKASPKTPLSTTTPRATTTSKENTTEIPAKDLASTPMQYRVISSPQSQTLNQANGLSASAEQARINQLQQQLYQQQMYAYGSQATYGSPPFGYAPMPSTQTNAGAYGGLYPGHFNQTPGFPPNHMVPSGQAQQQFFGSQSKQVKPPALTTTHHKAVSTEQIKNNVKQTTSSTTAVLAPPDEVLEDDEDMPPPPPSLEEQISQQVMANMAASERNKPTPHIRPPLAAFVNLPMDGDDEEEEVIDEDPISMDDDFVAEPSTKNVSPQLLTRKMLLGAFLVFFLSFLLMRDDGGLDTTPAVSTPCYIDNVAFGDSGIIINSCAESEGVPCPDGGSCKDGKLVGCPSKHYEFSEKKDTCLLTSTSMDSVTAIQDILKKWTLKQGCHLAATEYPMFAYKEIQLTDPLLFAIEPLEPSILESRFRTERRDGSLYIGLPSDMKLSLPFHCQLVSTLKVILGGFGSVCIAGIHFLFAMLVESFMAYPLATTIGVVVIYVLHRILKYRAYRKQLANDVDEIRRLAYEYLEESPGESHLVLHVRDHIVMKLFPKSQRQYLISDVWPRVIPDFNCDNRVRKSTRVVQGQPRDAWQWVAAVSAKKKPNSIQ
eukprot:scaffold909_cov135-Cylindrotheca_fusiformis.AAC.29